MVSKVIDIDCSVYSTDVKLAIFYMEIIELSKNKEIEKKKRKKISSVIKMSDRCRCYIIIIFENIAFCHIFYI